ncbi:hypothetical protein GO285_05297 [Ralstonia solanacearum]|nr:hypothetical protein [Ralstonia solanacearum]NKA91281.1 hypothetical protein [Ralstonia solanacearum]NKG13464.1 hypothetical protein [Ralstonia solanacearum]
MWYVLVSCRLSLFRSPPTLATTCLPVATAPFRFVLPPDSSVSVLPADTCVLVQLTSEPSPLPREALALAVTPKAAPLEPRLTATPTPPLTLLLERCISLALRAASRSMSPSAFRLTSPPPLMSLPCTVSVESCPAPVAWMLTLPPAATCEPAACVASCVVLLWLLLPPTVIEMLTPPPDFGSAATASAAFLPASAVVAPASTFIRPSDVCPAARPICCAVWIAAITGAVTATVRPDCLNCVSCVLCVVSCASRMSTFLAWMVMSPCGATTLLPTCW